MKRRPEMIQQFVQSLLHKVQQKGEKIISNLCRTKVKKTTNAVLLSVKIN